MADAFWAGVEVLSNMLKLVSGAACLAVLIGGVSFGLGKAANYLLTM